MPTTINPSDQTITQYNIQTGGASNLLNNVSPSATSGVAVISQGASAQPIFGTVVVAGGGTGNATQTAYSLVAGGTTTTGAFQAVGPSATTGQVLQSAGSSAIPAFSTATYPAVATGTGTLLRADGTNWVATTSTYPNTNAVSTLLYASGSNVMAALATANNGTFVTSSSGVPSILAGPGTSGNILQSNAAAAPSYSTSTYPTTNAVSTLLYASSANVMAALATANNGVLFTSGSGVPSIGTAPIVAGGTGVTSVTTAPAASAWAGWDANSNMSANSFISGYATTVTAAGTTTLLVGSKQQQFFTGSTTQTVLLPVTSTLVLGQSFLIVNNSSGVVTVQSSGANTIQAMAANSQLLVTCILTSGTSAASWNAVYSTISPLATPVTVANGGTGNASQAAYSLVAGGTTTTGAFQAVNPVATGSVLISGGTGALPSYSAYPQISGLGVGASAGSTAGITFDGTNFMNAYSNGTWTPTVVGAGAAGSTSYAVQTGYYTKIGSRVSLTCYLIINSATGTGDVLLGGFPFTIKNQSNNYPVGPLNLSAATWAWPTGSTMLVVNGVLNTTTAKVYGSGTLTAQQLFQMTNGVALFNYSLVYEA